MFGKILDLLNVPVQKEAMTTSAQFFDPTLKCFQFQDFQLAPILEDFGKILEIYKPMKSPFKIIVYHHIVDEMAYHLSIHEADLQPNFRVYGDFKGFLMEYLEKKVDDFATSL